MKNSFFSELKRRNVLRAAALYIGAAWAVSQGVAQLLPVFDFPNWVVRWFDGDLQHFNSCKAVPRRKL